MFRRKPAKSALKSKAVQGSVVAFSLMMAVIVSNVFDIAQRNTTDEVALANLESQENIVQEVLKNLPLLLTGVASAYALYGRMTASEDLYTPKGIPGPNKEDLENQQ